MLLDPTNEITVRDIESVVEDCDITVIEERNEDKYLSLVYYPSRTNFMVYYDDGVGDPVMIENLQAYEAHREYFKIKSEQFKTHP